MKNDNQSNTPGGRMKGQSFSSPIAGPSGSFSDAKYQAAKLTDFMDRGGDPGAWWASKDFGLSVRLAVETSYCEICASRCQP